MTYNERLKAFIEFFNEGNNQAYEPTRATAKYDKRSDEIVIQTDEVTEDSFYHITDVVRIANGLGLSVICIAKNDKVQIRVF